jgi:hypothetical protein
MQTQQVLNKVVNSVYNLRIAAMQAQMLVTKAQQYSKVPAAQQHNLQVAADMLQEAFKHIDDAACTVGNLYAD